MPSLPPPPIEKPGRIKVYHSLASYESTNPREISIEEGDIIYVKEEPNDAEYYTAKCGTKTGKIPKNFVNSDENMSSVEFPLHEAAKRGNLPFLKECLQNQVSVNSLDKSGSTALYWACHAGHVDIVKELLSTPNVTITSQNKMGDTPLHAASWKGHLNVIQILIESGANVHARNKDGKTAADMAGNPEIGALLKLTMRNVADPGSIDDYNSSEEEDAD
uniref:Osteoclast-stimulating factor 1 n=1 Tax=Acrobeloides nanus TaxID=290746 RepID=A0A914CDR8_9BILA